MPPCVCAVHALPLAIPELPLCDGLRSLWPAEDMRSKARRSGGWSCPWTRCATSSAHFAHGYWLPYPIYRPCHHARSPRAHQGLSNFLYLLTPADAYYSHPPVFLLSRSFPEIMASSGNTIKSILVSLSIRTISYVTFFITLLVLAENAANLSAARNPASSSHCCSYCNLAHLRLVKSLIAVVTLLLR